jgi:hypothetical protein
MKAQNGGMKELEEGMLIEKIVQHLVAIQWFLVP